MPRNGASRAGAHEGVNGKALESVTREVAIEAAFGRASRPERIADRQSASSPLRPQYGWNGNRQRIHELVAS